MTSTGWAERQKNLISDLKTYNDTDHYGAYFYSPSDHGTSHTYVVAPVSRTCRPSRLPTLVTGMSARGPAGQTAPRFLRICQLQ